MLLRSSKETAAGRMRSHTLYAINQTMTDVARDIPTLLEVVAGGPRKWRATFLTACRGLAVDEGIADSLFAFFCEHVQRLYGRGVSAGKLLDGLEVFSPPTQKEIDDSWEVESASSEEGRRHFYGADGHPEELIKRMVH